MSGARGRWLALGVLCMSLLAIVVDNTIVNVALPTLARDLDADLSALQWDQAGHREQQLVLVGG
jgi:hypothetical protein